MNLLRAHYRCGKGGCRADCEAFARNCIIIVVTNPPGCDGASGAAFKSERYFTKNRVLGDGHGVFGFGCLYEHVLWRWSARSAVEERPFPSCLGRPHGDDMVGRLPRYSTRGGNSPLPESAAQGNALDAFVGAHAQRADAGDCELLRLGSAYHAPFGGGG